MAARALKPTRAATVALLALAALLPVVLSDFTIGLIALWLPLVVLAISLDVL